MRSAGAKSVWYTRSFYCVLSYWAHQCSVTKRSSDNQRFSSFGDTVFSERELVVRPSVCLSVVTRLQRSCALPRRFKFSAMIVRHLVGLPWPPVDSQVKFYGDSPRRTPPSGELNTRGVAEYGDFEPIEGYISETVQDRRHVSINH